jgi:hypothetical protein
MMEPVSLTLGAVAAALVAKAEDNAAEKAVEGAAGALRRLVSWLRERFAGDKDPAGARALARVEDAPDSPSRIQELADVLEQRAETDGHFREVLKGLVAEARAAGVDVGTITQTVWGNQNVQNAGVTDSEIHVSYGQSPPPPGR